MKPRNSIRKDETKIDVARSDLKSENSPVMLIRSKVKAKTHSFFTFTDTPDSHTDKMTRIYIGRSRGTSQTLVREHVNGGSECCLMITCFQSERSVRMPKRLISSSEENGISSRCCDLSPGGSRRN